MQQDVLCSFVLSLAIDSITPGPAVATAMSRGASIKLTRTFPLIAGLVVGDLLLFFMVFLGLAAIAMPFVTPTVTQVHLTLYRLQ